MLMRFLQQSYRITSSKINMLLAQIYCLLKGVIESDNEYVSILKTIPENWERLKNMIEEIHPYDVPCIMKIQAEANEAYEHWIQNSVERKR